MKGLVVKGYRLKAYGFPASVFCFLSEGFSLKVPVDRLLPSVVLTCWTWQKVTGEGYR